MGQTVEWITGWMSGKNDEAARIALKGNTILTHTEGGKIAGIICVGIYGHKSEKGAVLWVREIAVHPDYQRRGIATKLLRQAMEYGAMHGAKRAFLAADETNLGAIKLYERMGFVRNEDECETSMYKPSR
jgi:ribosomal protein S18 acetylase RimI-like enzyme